MKRIAVLLAALAVGAMAQAAVSPGVDLTTPGEDYTNNAWSLGFRFTVSNSVVADRLGFYDAGRNGLSEGHDVGLYSSDGTLLRTATVTDADPWGEPGAGYWFKWHAMNEGAITLVPGNVYVLAAETGSELYTYGSPDFADGWATYQGSAYIQSDLLAFPTDGNSQIGYFGPNISMVPEPSSLVFVGAGVALLLRRIR